MLSERKKRYNKADLPEIGREFPDTILERAEAVVAAFLEKKAKEQGLTGRKYSQYDLSLQVADSRHKGAMIELARLVVRYQLLCDNLKTASLFDREEIEKELQQLKAEMRQAFSWCDQEFI